MKEVAKMMFEGELELRIKRKDVLDNDVQKACLLVIGQCAHLLQSKLEQQS